MDRVAERNDVAGRPDQRLPIPSEDLTRQYVKIKSEILAAIEETLPRGKYTMGPDLSAFESEWAAYCGTQRAVGTASGTAALKLAYQAVGVSPGDEVIIPSLTYVATAFSASHLGAIPVFADVDEHTFNIDPEEVRKAITPRTRAIVPVHLYGQPADIDDIKDIAAENGIPIVEDAAQAHGARYRDAEVGGLGALGCFSFYPHKNLGAYGDGGAITTNDLALDDRVRTLRYMGQHEKHLHEEVAYQERLDELQASILRVRLRHLPEWTAARQRWAALYDDLLADTPLTLPYRAPGRTHVFYMYTVRTPDRDALQAFLQSRGIGSQVIYPRAVPDQPAYSKAPCRVVSADRARSVVGDVLCLPVFPELEEEEVRAVSAAIHGFFAGR